MIGLQGRNLLSTLDFSVEEVRALVDLNEQDGLTLVDRQDSGGERPISLAYARNLLYVLNAGGAVGSARISPGKKISINSVPDQME